MNPSREGGLKVVKSCRRFDYTSHESAFAAVRFVFECGYKLKSRPETIATATAILHKFLRSGAENFNKYLVAISALQLALKATDHKYSVRDIINVAHHTLHRGSAPLELNDDYWGRRQALAQMELLILRFIQFQIPKTPHKYLLHYLKTLKTWINEKVWEAIPLAKTSMAFLQDAYHDAFVLDHPPQLLALACLNLAVECYGLQIPSLKDTPEKGWYTQLCPKATPQALWPLMDNLMDIYDRDAAIASR